MATQFVPVSVVVPCFNCMKTIDRCVRSVFAQSYRPMELILIDDASDDETLKYLYKLRENYLGGWIKVISLDKNCGPATARNMGLDIASQEYIAFLDSDDSWHHLKIEIQYLWMKNHSDASITSHRISAASCGPYREDVVLASPSEVQGVLVSQMSLLLRNRFYTSTVMMRRDIKLRMVDGKRYAEDYHLWLRIIADGHVGYHLRAELAHFYKPPYGAAGLTGDIWKLECGELDTYRRIYRSKEISSYIYAFVVSFSLIKFVRRCIIVIVRRVSPIWWEEN